MTGWSVLCGADRFLVESYKNLSPDTSSQMLLVMQQVALQTASYQMFNGVINATSQSPISITAAAPQSFQPPIAAIRTNVLWFASLVFSLITASFGILVKQWLREYLFTETTSPQARLRVRHLRYDALIRWHVFEIAAVLPLFQQISLALFFIGLCYFTRSVHESVGHTTVPLVAGWVFCFATVTILPAFFPHCPYKTTLLKRLLHTIHIFLVWSAQPLRRSAHILYRKATAESLWKPVTRWIEDELPEYNADALRPVEERAATTNQADIDILIGVDSLQSNDEILGTTMAEALQQAQPQWTDAVYFVLRILEHRLQRDNLVSSPVLQTTLDLDSLSNVGYTAIVNILSHHTNEAFFSEHGWFVMASRFLDLMHDAPAKLALSIFFHPTRHPLPESGHQMLCELFRHDSREFIILCVQLCPVLTSTELEKCDRFAVLIHFLDQWLARLDTDAESSLVHFETLMITRFRLARRMQEVQAIFPEGEFVLRGNWTAWPWPQIVSKAAMDSVVALLVSVVERALRHQDRNISTRLHFTSTQEAEPRIVESRPLDNAVGALLQFALIVDTDVNTSTRVKMTSAMGRCLATSAPWGAVTLIRALCRVQPSRAVYIIFASSSPGPRLSYGGEPFYFVSHIT